MPSFLLRLENKSAGRDGDLCSPAGATRRLGAGQTIGAGAKKVKHKERSRQQEAPRTLAENTKRYGKKTPKGEKDGEKWPLKKVFF